MLIENRAQDEGRRMAEDELFGGLISVRRQNRAVSTSRSHCFPKAAHSRSFPTFDLLPSHKLVINFSELGI